MPVPYAVPSDLRSTSEPSRYVQSLAAHSRPHLVAGPEQRAIAFQKSRFSRLYNEPEDARLTGVTRSLERRLLALNVSGTLHPMARLEARIA